MTTTIKYIVDVAVPINDHNEWAEVNDTITNVADRYKANIESAGTGFGLRDMQITACTKHQARKIRKALTATGLEFEYISIYNVRG